MAVSEITSVIKKRLRSSPYWVEGKTRENGQHLIYLRCPDCEKLEAWAYSDKPWSINCNRQNKCGARVRILELFPDLVTNFEKKYRPTEIDPNHPATQYLGLRGLKNSIKGLEYKYKTNIRNTGSGGVMFPIPTGNGQTAWNGRIFNPPPGEGKTHNEGRTKGVYWKHPATKYDPDRETYITESIIDALSLIEMGHQAISVLTAGQDPSNFDLPQFNKKVLAFDNDTAGAKGLKKWSKHFPDAKSVMPSRGDWNDFLLNGESFEDKREGFEFNANLAGAETAKQYAEVYYNYYDNAPGLFEFDECYYFSSLQSKPGNDKKLSTFCVSNFTVRVKHFQLDTTNIEEPVNKFFLNIKPRRRKPTQCIVKASELNTATSLRTMFLERARVYWRGDSGPYMALIRLIVETKAPVVRQLQTVGYDEGSNCYIFKDFMVDHLGNYRDPDKEGFFELSPMTFIRPAQYSTVKPVRDIPVNKIYNLVNEAWPDRGPAALSWMVAGWFVHVIKAEIGFFPFLSFEGDTQTGKTFLTRTMNACQCIDEEGLPMRKVNTGKGEIRKLAQRSGLFKALLEAGGKDNTRFDIDSILTLYNQNPLQVRALTTNDIRTHEIPFRATLSFVQNREPFTTKAQRERVISLQFKTKDLTEQTTEAFQNIMSIPVSELAYFFPYVMKHRKEIESEWHREYEKAKKNIGGTVADARIKENHALLLAFHRILTRALNIEHDLQNYVEDIANLKYHSCNFRAEDLADYVLNIVLDMESNFDNSLAIDLTEDELFIHLPDTCKIIKENGYPLTPNIGEVQKHLKEHPAFKDCRTHRFSSGTDQKPKKAWVFDTSLVVTSETDIEQAVTD